MAYLGGDTREQRHHPKGTSLMRSMSTNKTRTIITSAAALAVTAGLAVTTAGAASAATLPTKPLPREAYGSVELASPLQSESFLALQGGRYHGAVDYTNWTYAEPGSGVFAPAAGSHALVFTYQGSQYAHTLNGGLKLYALSPERLAFSGSGSYSGGHLDDQGPGRPRQGQRYDRVRRAVLQGVHDRQGRQRRVGLRHRPVLDEAGAHVHHARRVVRLGAALHRADPVRAGAASRRDLQVHHPGPCRGAGRNQGDRQGARRRVRPEA